MRKILIPIRAAIGMALMAAALAGFPVEGIASEIEMETDQVVASDVAVAPAADLQQDYVTGSLALTAGHAARVTDEIAGLPLLERNGLRAHVPRTLEVREKDPYNGFSWTSSAAMYNDGLSQPMMLYVHYDGLSPRVATPSARTAGFTNLFTATPGIGPSTYR